MKLTLFILLCLSVSLTFSQNVNNDGQPGCKTSEEMNVKIYKNNWDPTKYWICYRQGVPAKETRCPDGHAFDGYKNACVTWDKWEWTPSKDPPSFPDKKV